MTYDYSIHYNRLHDHSEAHAAIMAKLLWPYLKADLPEDLTTPVLDIGCGWGFALRTLRSAGFTNLQGLDISEQQAAVARNAGLHVTVVKDTCSWLQQHKNCFGVILLLDVLEHCPVSAQIDILRAIRDSLLPGGRLILQVPNASSPLASCMRYFDFEHCSSFSKYSLFFVLRNAGFTKIKMDTTKGIEKFPWRWWNRDERIAFRKWLVRFVWAQVYKAELPGEIDDTSFELNLKAVAFNYPA